MNSNGELYLEIPDGAIIGSEFGGRAFIKVEPDRAFLKLSRIEGENFDIEVARHHFVELVNLLRDVADRLETHV